MAKKAVAGFRGDKQQKNVVKCIRMVKSDRSGAYAFKEEFIPTEKVKDYFTGK
ncbi:MAG: DUF4295 domain-containing protein [Bacteroidales bacterium]|nr:DUF4295 domain-containing protein [Bacteroidales bacterium]